MTLYIFMILVIGYYLYVKHQLNPEPKEHSGDLS